MQYPKKEDAINFLISKNSEKSSKKTGIVYTTVVERPTGRHAIYFTVQTSYPKDGWMATFFEGRELFAMHSFTFML